MVSGTSTTHTVTRWQDPFTKAGAVTKKGALNRPGIARAQTLKVACHACNTGWMKRIVDESIPILTPLGRGEWFNLTSQQRITLASWIVMFSMSHEFADKETAVVSFGERQAFSHNGQPSENWCVAIGRFEPHIFRDLVFHRALLVRTGLGEHAKGQVTAFEFGNLLMVSFYSETRPASNLTNWFRSLGLHPLWPLAHSDIRKPFIAFTYGAQDLVVESLTEFLGPRRQV